MKDILKGSFIIFFFKILGAVALFLVHLLISRYYGAEVLGTFNLILALLMMTTLISKLGLDVYIVRIIPSLKDDNERISLFLKEVIKILLISSSLSSLLLFLFFDLINDYLFKSFDSSDYLFSMLFLIIPFTFFNVLPEVFRGFHEIKKYSFFRNLSQNILILIFLLTSLIFNLELNPIYILYFSIFIITIILIYVLFKFLKSQSITLVVPQKYGEKILIHSYPMFLTSGMFFIISYSDIFMISYFMSEKDVGYYTAALKIASLITFVLAAINGYIAPKISHAYSQKEFSKIKEIYHYSLKIIISISVPIFTIIFLFPNELMGLFGSSFNQYGNVLLILSIAFLISSVCGSVGYILNMTDNQSIYMKIILISLIINVTLNYLLIPQYGITGAATATLIAKAFWNITGLIILKRKQIV